MNTPRKKSWMTTFFGWLAGIAGIVASASEDPKIKLIAGSVAGAATLALGTAARDNKVSSEDVGAK
jgi:hypothetical protein